MRRRLDSATLSQLAFPKKATQISHGRNPYGATQLLKNKTKQTSKNSPVVSAAKQNHRRWDRVLRRHFSLRTKLLSSLGNRSIYFFSSRIHVMLKLTELNLKRTSAEPQSSQRSQMKRLKSLASLRGLSRRHHEGALKIDQKNRPHALKIDQKKKKKKDTDWCVIKGEGWGRLRVSPGTPVGG